MKKYLHTADFIKLKQFCNEACSKIVIEQSTLKEYEKNYYREQYKAFLYAKKVFSQFEKKKISVSNVELYHHFKHYKNFNTKSKGEAAALYIIMNKFM